MREQLVLACTVCKRRNYSIEKNKQKHPGRIEYKKFCPECNKRTIHKETR